ncbi:MAG: glutamate--tRNA ligase [Chloroflexi bacterium]|nr:glutamate--tRNA ligase [Chloroflexota bacterium]
MAQTRVRFAPSPTGYLHIGGARTALFNWLYARHTGGQFILRIEDTDRKRFQADSLQDILDSLRWLGLDWDEGPEVGGDYGPYFQSERLEIYQHWADWLVEHGHAYRCYCTAEELAEMREQQRAAKQKIGYDRRCRWLTPEERAAREAEGRAWVVRLAVPLEGSVTFHDAIRGDITYENALLQDAVLLKSDGWPTYHLANVVDDHLMRITHIMRGDEWIASVPLHWHLYRAFGWEPPVWAHLPVILNPSGKGKMSKREIRRPDGAVIPVYVRQYREMGYLPEAIFNFLSGIGWSLDGETEIYDRETAIRAFDISGVHPSPAALPADKLLWMNGVYIRELEPDDLLQRLTPYLSQALSLPEARLLEDERLRLLLPHVQERIKLLTEAADLLDYLYIEPVIDDLKALIPRKTTPEQVREGLSRAIQALESLDDWSEAAIEKTLRELAADLGMKAGQLFNPIRVAVTGKRVAPPLFVTLRAVGREATCRRLRAALARLDNSVHTEQASL